MNDRELDAALSSALDVDHSPEFRATVRARVAAEPPPRRVLAGWPALAGGAALASAALWIGLASPAVNREPPAAVPAESAREAVRRPLPPAVPAGPAVGSSPSARPAPSVEYPAAVPMSERAPAASPFPEVIVAEEDRRALGLFVRRVHEGLVPPVFPTEDPPGSVPVIARVEISPLAIEPLEIPRLEEGERQ